MFEEKYKQANDSIHPREGLLWEMEQKQRRPAPYIRWSAVAACALVVLSLGLVIAGRAFDGAKSADTSMSAAAESAPREVADEAYVEYNVEDAAEVVEATEAETDGGEVNLASELAGGTGEREVAAVSDTLMCVYKQETALLQVYSLTGEELGELMLSETKNTSCTAMELEETILYMYFEDGRELLIDLSDPTTPQLMEDEMDASSESTPAPVEWANDA